MFFLAMPVAFGLASAIMGAQAVSLPACQTQAAPSQTVLSQVRSTLVTVPGGPFGITYASKQKHVGFVALQVAQGGGSNSSSSSSVLGVLDTSAFAPTLQHQISLPEAYVDQEGALGLTLTHDGKYIIMAAGPGFIVVDAALAAKGDANAVVGAFNGTTQNQKPGNSAIEVTVSRDDRYVFVSQEYGSTASEQGNVDVFRLNEAAGNGSVTGHAIGFQNLGRAVVGTSLSPDGRRLYATSEVAGPKGVDGSLSVLDVDKLETQPGNAVVATTKAGCQPVRTLVSPDGKVVWVTARASNHLLAFDADKLVSSPGTALLASVQVGTSPVGLIWAKNYSRILTADSDRFNYPGATTGVSVVNVTAALAGESAVLGRIPTGMFPRELATSPDGKTVLISDNASSQIQAIDTTTIP